MHPIRLIPMSGNFHPVGGVRIHQGDTHAGPEVQSGILKSCVCVGFYCAERRIAATSHVTGFRQGGGHQAGPAVAALVEGLRRLGVGVAECVCFVLGGALGARHVYDDVVVELRRRGIVFRELDVLGNVHRKFLLDPGTGELRLFRKEVGGRDDPPMQRVGEAGVAGVAGGEIDCFHDPRRRLITGATVFFRNRVVHEMLGLRIVPDLLQRGERIHVWCAGCSTGMEVYSTAMRILELMDRRRRGDVDFRILGTDISPEALETARAGEYQVTGRALQSIPAGYLKYLERPDSSRVRVGPVLRRTATFIERDLREGSRNHLFDLILCDHVLQYYPPEEQTGMLDVLVRAVAEGGYVFVSSPSRVVRERMGSVHGFGEVAPHLFQRGG